MNSRRFRRLGAAVLATVLGLTGCTAETSVGYQPPFVPFKLTVDSHGNVTPSIEGEIVTVVGTFDVSVGLGQDEEADDLSTLLYVYTYVDGRLKSNVFRINTSEKISFVAKGKLYGTVEHGRVELKADPGVPTTIDVFDPDSDERAARPQPPYTVLRPEFRFSLPDPLGGNWDADFDARAVKSAGEMSASKADLSWEYGYGIRSYQTLGFGTPTRPSPEACRNKANSAAAGIVKAETLRVGQTFCVETDALNIAWVRLVGVQNPEGDMERASLSFVATIWIKTAK